MTTDDVTKDRCCINIEKNPKNIKNIKRNCLCQSGYGLRNNRGCPNLGRRRAEKKRQKLTNIAIFYQNRIKGGLKRTIICNHHIFIMTSLLDLVHQNYKYPLRYSKLVTLMQNVTLMRLNPVHVSVYFC